MDRHGEGALLGLTVADVLAEAGHPPGKPTTLGQYRTRCPVHGGTNPYSFAYSERGWHCFGCGESGNAWQLRERVTRSGSQRLLTYKSTPKAILGLEDDEPPIGRPSRTRRILAALHAQSLTVARTAGLRYREADRWLYAVEAYLRTDPPDREDTMEVGMEWLAQQGDAEEILCKEDAFRLVLRRFLT